jgi:hypothetical protein
LSHAALAAFDVIEEPSDDPMEGEDQPLPVNGSEEPMDEEEAHPVVDDEVTVEEPHPHVGAVMVEEAQPAGEEAIEEPMIMIVEPPADPPQHVAVKMEENSDGDAEEIDTFLPEGGGYLEAVGSN